MKYDLAISTALVGLTVLGFGCSSNSDADWEEVQKAATRVESGLRHETLIALRSKVADLDTAVSNYARANGGNQDRRAKSINQAVDAIEWAMDHQKSGSIGDGTQDFDFYAARPYLDLEPKCWQEDGKLYINETDMTRACLAYAQETLLEPDKGSVNRAHDFSSLRKSCASDHESYKTQNARQAEAKRVEHSRNWPLQVDIKILGDLGNKIVGDLENMKYEIDGGEPHEDILHRGQSKHIDAKHKMRIFASTFRDEYQRVEIKVNGKTWTAEWSKTVPDDYYYDLETTITVGE